MFLSIASPKSLADIRIKTVSSPIFMGHFVKRFLARVHACLGRDVAGVIVLPEPLIAVEEKTL